MISRREIFGIAGTAGIAAAASSLAVPAAAQEAAGMSTFDRVRSSKKLRIGAVLAANPFYYKDLKTGEWVGIYIDLAKEIAKELEAELDILETTYGNAVLDLQSDKVDIFLGLNPTPKRALAIDFSEPLFQNGYCVLAKEGYKPATWAEMNNPDVKIAVDIGSSQDILVSRFCPNATIMRLKSADEATVALQSGRADVQCITFFLAMGILKKNPSVGVFVMPTPIMRATSHIGFRREPDKTMRDFVDAWIVYSSGLGLIRSIVINNFDAVGIKEADFPPDVEI